MKSACYCIQLAACAASVGMNWYWYGWQPVAISAAAGVVSLFFGAIARRIR